MTRLLRKSIIILLASFSLLAFPAAVCAVPPLPSSLYGAVTVNGASVPDGTLVQALIGGQVVAFTQTQTYQGASVYALDVPGDDPGTEAVEGGREGDLIQFKIGGILADQTAVWRSGTNVNLDLSAESASTPLPPQPPPAVPPTQTPIILHPTSKPAASATTAASPVAAASQTDAAQAPLPPGTQVHLPAIAQGAASVSPQAAETTETPAEARAVSLSAWWIAIPVGVFLAIVIGIGLVRRRRSA